MVCVVAEERNEKAIVALGVLLCLQVWNDELKIFLVPDIQPSLNMIKKFLIFGKLSHGDSYKKDSYEKVCNDTLLLFVSIDSFDHFSLFVFFIFFFIETTIISLFAC